MDFGAPMSNVLLFFRFSFFQKILVFLSKMLFYLSCLNYYAPRWYAISFFFNTISISVCRGSSLLKCATQQGLNSLIPKYYILKNDTTVSPVFINSFCYLFPKLPFNETFISFAPYLALFYSHKLLILLEYSLSLTNTIYTVQRKSLNTDCVLT